MDINDSTQKHMAVEQAIVEVYIEYLLSILNCTEYRNVPVSGAHTKTDNEQSIVVNLSNEDVKINTFNGVIDYDYMGDMVTYRRESDVKIDVSINMPDNDALWMLCKYIGACMTADLSKLSSTGLVKLTSPPRNEGISLVDVGSRKIWSARLSMIGRVHYNAELSAENS